MTKRVISRWIVQKVVREAAEGMGVVGATPELIAEKIEKREGTHLPVSIVENALEEMDDEFYEGEDELFAVDYRVRMKQKRADIYASLSLVLAIVFLIIGVTLGHVLLSYRFFMLCSMISGFVTAFFGALHSSTYVTWKSIVGLFISLEAQLLLLYMVQ